MPALDLTISNAVVAATLGLENPEGIPLTSVLPMRIRFMASNGDAQNPGEEIVPSNQEGGYIGGPYAPVIEFASPSNGTSTSTTDVTVSMMPACVITGVEIWDSGGDTGTAEPVIDPATGEQVYDEQGQPMITVPPGNGTRKWFGALASPKQINEGDTFTIVAGSLTVTLA